MFPAKDIPFRFDAVQSLYFGSLVLKDIGDATKWKEALLCGLSVPGRPASILLSMALSSVRCGRLISPEFKLRYFDSIESIEYDGGPFASVVNTAHQRATSLHHNSIGSEHLLEAVLVVGHQMFDSWSVRIDPDYATEIKSSLEKILDYTIAMLEHPAYPYFSTKSSSERTPDSARETWFRLAMKEVQ